MNNQNNIKYTAPVAGYYEVSAEVFTFTPTGNLIETENPNYTWYRFWEPKTILVPEIKKTTSWIGREIRFLHAKETIKNTIIRRL